MSESSIQPEPTAEPSPPAPAPSVSAPPDLGVPEAAGAPAIKRSRNPLALAADYCALFSILPVLGLILGPLAVLFGVIGLRRVRRDPEAPGSRQAWCGVVLGGLMTLVNWGILGYAAMNYDFCQRVYYEAFGDPPPRPEEEPDSD